MPSNFPGCLEYVPMLWGDDSYHLDNVGILSLLTLTFVTNHFVDFIERSDSANLNKWFNNVNNALSRGSYRYVQWACSIFTLYRIVKLLLR